jgi:hypothetical protein
MAAMLAGSMGFQGHNIMGQGLAGPRLSDRQTEARLQQSLHENSMLISKIRENLVTGRMRENGNLMEKVCPGIRGVYILSFWEQLLTYILFLRRVFFLLSHFAVQ